MNTIKFSHNYYKFPFHPELYKCKLLQVFEVNKKDLSTDFLKYDTAYFDEENGVQFYDLKAGNYLLLIFQLYKDEAFWNVFTTLRPAHPKHKIEYYKSKVGQEFKIEVV